MGCRSPARTHIRPRRQVWADDQAAGDGAGPVHTSSGEMNVPRFLSTFTTLCLKMNRVTVKQEVVAGLTTFSGRGLPGRCDSHAPVEQEVWTVRPPRRRPLALMSIFQPGNGLVTPTFPFVVGPGLGGSVILGVTLTQVEQHSLAHGPRHCPAVGAFCSLC